MLERSSESESLTGAVSSGNAHEVERRAPAHRAHSQAVIGIGVFFTVREGEIASLGSCSDNRLWLDSNRRF